LTALLGTVRFWLVGATSAKFVLRVAAAAFDYRQHPAELIAEAKATHLIIGQCCDLFVLDITEPSPLCVQLPLDCFTA
jgi:hypothetical protein